MPRTSSSRFKKLTDQDHLARGKMVAVYLEAVEVGAAGYVFTVFIPTVPRYSLFAGRVHTVYQGANFLAHGIVDGQLYLSRLGQSKTQGSLGVERIGVIGL
jgi:hypothetical protein